MPQGNNQIQNLEEYTPQIIKLFQQVASNERKRELIWIKRDLGIKQPNSICGISLDPDSNKQL